MKIFIHAHYYLPRTLAGAEKFLHEIAKYLISKGHEVVISIDENTSFQYEGVNVVPNRDNIQSWYKWADAVLTHLINAEDAIYLAAQNQKPLFHLLHNNKSAARDGLVNNYVIYNSNALKQELNLDLPSIVVHPPINYAQWQNNADHFYNEYITLVNCCAEKGGLILKQLAATMPDHRFMGVKGGYNTPIIEQSPHKNIQYTYPREDMRAIYNSTRIIIMPSHYESWGMVASEAMASGIPVICSDTPGLRENCGDAAIYAERTAGVYRYAIETLNDKEMYDSMVLRGKARSQPNELDKLLIFMEEKKGRGPDEVDFNEMKEKEEQQPLKEKHVIETKKEKKHIIKPGRKTKKNQISVNG
jgi:glycosyltransferase involved in cell wall biosynthesis